MDGFGNDIQVEPTTFNTMSKLTVRHNTEVYTRPENRIGRTQSVPGSKISDTKTLVTRESLCRNASYIKTDPRTKPAAQTADQKDIFLHSTFLQSDQAQLQNNVIERSVNVLERHKTRMKILDIASNTMAFHTALETLQDRHTVCITGQLGSGKTFTALNLLCKFLQENDDWSPYILQSPFEVEHLKNTCSCVVVLADNFIVQRNGANKMTLKIWIQTMKKILANIERRRVRFIFTTDMVNVCHQMEDDLLMSTLINLNNTHNLDDNSLTLEYKERKKVLTLYSKHFCRTLYSNSKRIEAMVHGTTEGSLGFPLVSSMIGVIGCEEVTANHWKSLYNFVSDNYLNNSPSFVLMVLVLVLQDECTLNNMRQEKQATLKNILDALQIVNCSLTDLTTGLTKLKRQNVLIEDETGVIAFTHEIFSYVILYYISQEFISDILPFLSIMDINYISSLPEIINSEGAVLPIVMNVFESSPALLSQVVSRVNDILENGKSQDFVNIALSPLWYVQPFADTIFSMYGYQIFFVTDEQKYTLFTYLVRTHNSQVVDNVIDFIISRPLPVSLTMKVPIQQTLEEACLYGDIEMVLRLKTLVPNPDASVMYSAIEGGNVEILEAVLDTIKGTVKTIPVAVIQFTCQHGSLESLKCLLNYIDSYQGRTSKTTLLLKRNNEGETLLHYTARGESLATFEHLVEQGCDPTLLSVKGRSVLHAAVEYGQLQMVRVICSSHSHLISISDTNNMTCLHLAAREGHADIVQFLINHDTESINYLTDGGYSIFHYAASNGHTELCRFLLTLDLDMLSTPCTNSLFPVQLAAKYGKTNVVKFLLIAGSDINTKTVDGRSLLHLAAYHGHLATVKYLCSHYPKLLYDSDIYGNTVIHDAAANGNLQVFQYLQAVGEDALMINDEGTTTLHDACFHGKLEMTKYLCKLYPDMLNQTNKNGYTPCFGAALGGHVNIIKFLVTEGADLTQQSTDGSTPLHEATFAGKQEVVDYLTSNFTKLVYIMNNQGYIPCHFAAQEDHLEILMKLVCFCEKELPKTKEHQTLVHVAVYNGSINVMKFLCHAFPDLLLLKDKDGALPIHYASRSGNIDMFSFLVEQGQNPEATTASGSTCLHLAAFDGNVDMVAYLCNKYPQLTREFDTSGHNAIHYAAGCGEIPVVLNILEAGVDPLLRARNGSTTLSKAAFGGWREMTDYLCAEFPVLLTMADEFGCNILHYAACGSNSIDIIRFAIEHGIDAKSTANDGSTMLHIAAYHGKFEVVKYICEEFPSLTNMADASGNTPDISAVNGGSQQVIRYFNSIKKSKNVSTIHSTSVLADVCCYPGSCCTFSDVCKLLGSIFCFCRRTNNTDSDSL
ncbi:hypothetical protein ACF0H5_007767 [Mactra antiquata]